MRKICGFLLIFCAFSCSYKPILDDNYKYRLVSEEKRELDIENCMKKGDEFLKKSKMRRVGKETVRKGAIGGFFGSIFGFVFAGNSRSLLRGAGVGAGVGAVTGAVMTAGEGKITPDRVKQRYVARCLNQKGYGVIGWE